MSQRRGRERRGRPAPAPVSLRTAHAFAEVIVDPAHPSSRTLLLDGREAGQVDLQEPRVLAFAYMRRIADLIDAFRPAGAGVDVVHVGGGACALPRYVEATRPRSHQVVFELDPGVVALAHDHLGLRVTPRLRVTVGDAADLIAAREDRSADLVIGDAFDGPHVPERLSDADFVGQVRRVLRPAGVYALNVIDVPPLDEARHHADLVLATFAHVLWVAPAGVLRGRAPGNVVVLASRRAVAQACFGARSVRCRTARAGPGPGGALASGASRLGRSSWPWRPRSWGHSSLGSMRRWSTWRSHRSARTSVAGSRGSSGCPTPTC